MEPLAKPSGITLTDHRQHVLEEAERLLGLHPPGSSGHSPATPGLPFLTRKYAALVPGADLVARVRNAAWFHDKGKEHPLWQNACRADYDLYRQWRRQRGLDPDGVDPSDWDSYRCEQRGNTGPHLMKASLRHEIASLQQCAGNGLDLAERVAIAAHHGKLGARHEHRWRADGDPPGEFAGLWEALVREDDRVVQRFRSDPERLFLQRYEVAGVRALLQLADTRASRGEAGGALASVTPFRYEWPYGASPKRHVQDLALEHEEDWVKILRAPTGSGKTDAALLWGQRQVELGRADRVVIAMPTRFTANALAISSEKSLSETGLYHSSAWHARFGDERRGTPDYEMAQERHRLARLLVTPLTVCTIDHLLLALTGAREDHHATFFFLANAAVVFDEVDFYDPFVQANLKVLLHALRTIRVPILLMSATVPESARQQYAIPEEIRETYEQASGVRRLHGHPPVEHPEDAADVLDRMIEAGTGIVYANTVERAYRYWKYLTQRAGNVPVFLYHSRFTEPDKKRIEEAIVNALGRAAWDPERPGKPKGIAVLTQIGEMSINISAPLMLSDLCPWDRLAQRAGRLARFKDLIPEGALYVAEPRRDGELYPAPYGSFEGPLTGWIAGEPLLQTKVRIETLTTTGSFELTPDRLVREVNDLYPEVGEPDARTRANVTALRQMIRDNWMIVPKTEPRDDEADVPGQWRSRDIPPQVTLLVLDEGEVPEGNAPLRFDTHADLYRIQLEHGVTCPHYLVARALKRGALSLLHYTIGHDPETYTTYWCVRGYDVPDERGQGGGLGALSVRDQEDSLDHVCL